MSNPTFTQSSGDPRIYWLDSAAWAPSGGFALVFDNAAIAASNPPASISLLDSWTTYPCLYATLGTKPTPAEEPAFADAMTILASQLGAAARFFWITDPASSIDIWRNNVLYVDQAASAPTGTVQRPTVFSIGQFGFSVSGGQTIGLTTVGFSISETDNLGTGSVNPGFQLLAPQKTWPVSPSASGATVISVNGATAGAFLLAMSLDAGEDAQGQSDYDLLDIGFRFGFTDPDNEAGSLLTSQYYPFFAAAPPAAIPMNIQIDPSGILEATRSRLSYSAAVAVGATHYTSHLGYGVSATPDGESASGLPAGFAFHKAPRSTTEQPQDDPLYLGPIGKFTFTISAPSGATTRLTCGIAGIEYFGFSSAGTIPIEFSAAGAAFAGNFPNPQASHDGTGDGPPALETTATAPYALVQPPASGAASYYAQPDNAAFFSIRDGGTTALLPYLNFFELTAADITSADTTAYPMLPYAGVVADNLTLIQQLEDQRVSPVRRAALGTVVANSDLAALNLSMMAVGGAGQTAVTPQGLLAEFSATGTWENIQISPAISANTLPRLAFNTPSQTFHGALQSNQLFMVAADGALLMQNCDLNYWITDDVLGDLVRLSGTQAIPAAVIETLRADGRSPETGAAAFATMLTGTLSADDQQYIPIITKYSAYFELVIEGWRFRLSPTLWADQNKHPPLMIFKFARGNLTDFAKTPDTWAWQDIAKLDGSIETTKTLLNTILDEAIADVKANKDQSKLYDFVTNVATNPAWTGVLFLNASVPFSSVPQELSGLAAGVDLDEFYAHHVGIAINPINVDTAARTLAQEQGSLFGLINYVDPEDIAYADAAFDFKVLLLQILFENSAIADFAGQIELFINTLFHEAVTLYNSTHYNNLLFTGSYQRQGDSGHYIFASHDANIYGTASAEEGGNSSQVVLPQIEIDQAQFVTETTDSVVSTTTNTRFILSGRLRFSALNKFDAFSFGPTLDDNGGVVEDGYLSFSGLSVDMSFPVNAPDMRTFVFDSDGMSFDPADSLARVTSFFQRFPLQLGGLIAGPADKQPKDFGYLPLETPLSQPGFSKPWYGLIFNVDLGTLGALSSAPAMSASILVAWSPSLSGSDVNIGLKLPGIQSARALLPLQGVVDLGFQSTSLLAGDDLSDPAYTLRFENFFLRFLGWKFRQVATPSPCLAIPMYQQHAYLEIVARWAGMQLMTREIRHHARC